MKHIILLAVLLVLGCSSRVFPPKNDAPFFAPKVYRERIKAGNPAPDFSQFFPEQPEPDTSPSKPRVRVCTAIVTACSPQDPADSAYYARHGYEGATYNIAADYRVFPKGTLIRVPGYMDVSYPGKWWRVDSRGGSIIRRATQRGVIQIDVKYRTLYSVRKWGRKVLTIEYILPKDQ